LGDYVKEPNCLAVGYMRYTTKREQAIINELYGHLRLYTNFFQPVMKLVDKERIGSKVKKKYDLAKTPYQTKGSLSLLSWLRRAKSFSRDSTLGLTLRSSREKSRCSKRNSGSRPQRKALLHQGITMIQA
jgi:hypothetical protein